MSAPPPFKSSLPSSPPSSRAPARASYAPRTRRNFLTDPRLALATAALGALGLAATGSEPRPVPLSVADPPGPRGEPVAERCPAGTFLDHDVCVRLPTVDDADGVDAPAVGNLHRDRQGRWESYEQIPRRPDRPADYNAYRYPVPPGLADGKFVVSGYDLDRPDPMQRRGARLHAVGHGGVDLIQARDTLVSLVALERQQGDADVVFVGWLFGNTVVTRHTVREAGRLRDYLMLYGHLDRAAPGVVAGRTLRDADAVGFVGDSGSPELVHLHLEARRVRDGVDVKGLAGAQLLAASATVVCDPRNVLPLR